MVTDADELDALAAVPLTPSRGRAGIRAFIKQDTKLLALYDRAAQRGDGGTNNPSGINQHTPEAEKASVYNVHSDLGGAPARPAGNSKQAGLRRLEKAVDAGDPHARGRGLRA